MPLPERLRAWLDEDRWNFQILTAMMDGVVAGAQGEPLGERALKLGYAARTAQGDAFEAGHEYGKEHRIARPEAGEFHRDDQTEAPWQASAEEAGEGGGR